MEECIFCKILKGEIKTNYLYEDEDCAVFSDINPKAKTHLLIVPKKHIVSIAEMGKEDYKVAGRLMECARIVGKKFGLKGYNLQINVGKEGGQEIPHLHIHLMSKFG